MENKLHIIDALYEAKKAAGSGCIADETIYGIADDYDMDAAAVRDLADFYDMTGGEVKAGKVIEICAGNPCELCGNEWIAEQISEELGLDPGEASFDGKIGVKYMNCCGHCAAGPVVRVGETVYEEMTPEKLAELLRNLTA